MAVAPLCMVDGFFCSLGSRSTVLGSSPMCSCFSGGFSVVVRLFLAAVAAAGDCHPPVPECVAVGVFWSLGVRSAEFGSSSPRTRTFGGFTGAFRDFCGFSGGFLIGAGARCSTGHRVCGVFFFFFLWVGCFLGAFSVAGFWVSLGFCCYLCV